MADKKPYPPTPELDKMKAVHEKSQAIGEFFDIFLQEKGLTLCTFRLAGNNGKPRYVWRHERKFNGQKIKGVEPTAHDCFNLDADNNPEYEAWPDQYLPQHQSVEKLLAEYFEIDLNKCEMERRAILAHIRGEEA